jgi:hypothetical protein
LAEQAAGVGVARFDPAMTAGRAVSAEHEEVGGDVVALLALREDVVGAPGRAAAQEAPRLS